MYAGFWKRFFAMWIDGVIMVIFFGITMGIFAVSVIFADGVKNMEEPSSFMQLLSAVYYIIYFLFPILYFSLFESSSYQATPGKMALGIKVTDMEGNRLTFSQSLCRNLAKIVSNFTMYIGYVMAGFTQRKQALHDKITDCLVVTKDAVLSDLQPLPKTSPWMIAIIVGAVLLPFFLFIAGIIAAILIPSYFMMNSTLDADNAIGTLKSVQAAQKEYKLKKGEYALSEEDLISEIGLNSLLLRNCKFNYTIRDDSATAYYKRFPNFILTACYDKDTICIDKRNTQLEKYNLTVAAPHKCCK